MCPVLGYHVISFCVGLLTDDVRMEDKYFLEAVNMLPHDVKVQRDFRIQRAFQLSYLRTTLPKEQWTKLEDVCGLVPIR